jgi:uncharacterized protein YneF (UPF0154 family)
MTGWEIFWLCIFIVVLLLLFFAAFGGSNITEQSVEEYMNRLINKEGEPKGK